MEGRSTSLYRRCRPFAECSKCSGIRRYVCRLLSRIRIRMTDDKDNDGQSVLKNSGPRRRFDFSGNWFNPCVSCVSSVRVSGMCDFLRLERRQQPRAAPTEGPRIGGPARAAAAAGAFARGARAASRSHARTAGRAATPRLARDDGRTRTEGRRRACAAPCVRACVGLAVSLSVTRTCLGDQSCYVHCSRSWRLHRSALQSWGTLH
jgi:hypothetical protein